MRRAGLSVVPHEGGDFDQLTLAENIYDDHPVCPGTQRGSPFDHPDYQKLVISLRIAEGDPVRGYKLALEHRTRALSAGAYRKFALYWLAIKPGGNFVSYLLLRAIKRRAEQAAAAP